MLSQTLLAGVWPFVLIILERGNDYLMIPSNREGKKKVAVTKMTKNVHIHLLCQFNVYKN